tara:strand:+ start:227 stop:727 length:501 start_codon:yes stop_codon:yes gene_type:complete
MANTQKAEEERVNKQNAKDDEWESLLYDAREFMKDADLPKSIIDIVNMNIELGNSIVEERGVAIKSIKDMLKNRNGTPFRRGLKSRHPAYARISIDAICQDATDDYATFYNSRPYYRNILKKHQKSGGGNYDGVDDFSRVMVKRLRDTLNAMIDDGDWDGKIESLY